MKKITKIEPAATTKKKRKRRVAAYCRVFTATEDQLVSNNDIDYCNKISKDGYYKPEEIVLMPIPGSGSKEFLFCVKMYCEM